MKKIEGDHYVLLEVLETPLLDEGNELHLTQQNSS